jgi:phosphoglycolate phosphatase-like HAD superfamily hydrolase
VHIRNALLFTLCELSIVLALLFETTHTGYNTWYADMHVAAMRRVFAGMGRDVPTEAEQLSHETQRLAMAQCDAIFPGVRETLLNLKEVGFTLHLASGNDSLHLQRALGGAGLESLFERHYGPDLIDCVKEGPLYYERIFADLNLSPQKTVVIDNDPNALNWAISLGAKAIQVDFLPYKQVPIVDGTLAHVRSFAEIYDVLKQKRSERYADRVS